MTVKRKPNGETREFVADFLESHPGLTGPEIVGAGEIGGFSRPSIMRDLQALRGVGLAQAPGAAVASEVGKVLAILQSNRATEAKLAAAEQLARESSLAPPVSAAVIELLEMVPNQSTAIRFALLAVVQRAVRAAFEGVPEGAGESGGRTSVHYARRAWGAGRNCIDEFLSDRGDAGTMAWNTACLATDHPGIAGDAELIELARRAIAVEADGGVREPSPAIAFLTRATRTERLRDQVRPIVFERLEFAKSGEEKRRILRLVEKLDIGPMKTSNEVARTGPARAPSTS